MPIGSSSVFCDIIDYVVTRRPESILDLGVGYGINGAGIRNWLDSGHYPFKTTLVGVEVWEAYKSPLWDCYNIVHECSIEYYVENIQEKFDCVIMTDVIEHFEKEEGLRLIESIKKILSPNGYFLLSTPAIWIEQGPVHNNKYETHKSLWSLSDFESYEVLKDGTPDNYGHMMYLVRINS
jgi:SAM-dependent methyltransferase